MSMGGHMRARIRLATSVLSVAAILVPANAANAAPAAPPAPASGAASTIAWAPCAEDPTAECGTLAVPVDWNRPHGPKIDLALARRKATDPAARIGSLLVNPGGPGGSGVDLVINFGFRPLGTRFDVVGFDPRGVGRSHPVVCSTDLLARRPSPVLTSQADFDRAVSYNRELWTDCRAHTGPLMEHADTLSVVRDLDAIRAAVGDRQLSYFGISYGTLIGQQYAETFPHRVRALALDSNMDHSLGTAGFLYTEAWSAQDSFDEFVAGCGRDPGCSLSGRDIRAFWAHLLARAERGELTLPGTDFRFDAFNLIDFALLFLSLPAWRDLADILIAIDAGVPVADLTPAATPFVAARRARPAGRQDVAPNPFPAVFCEDWRLPVRNYAAFATHMAVQRAIAPDMRYYPSALFGTVSCLGWPSAVNNPQHRLRVDGSNRLLMLNALHDPDTGYLWAVNAARQLGDTARLVTYEGWGHGVYGRGPCTVSIVHDYLFTRSLPPEGTRCPAFEPEARSAGPAGSRPDTPGW
jgi:pimeloyl-ACP methyl ester carboxylesterase